ncbi:multidrug efflux pump [Altererythrobacter atlanticus]|uniref:Multidrug export protein AcrF n=1 Tax=Croceibacterium atlanticum TaxID=1267766 RepID=A0A0F7KX91_9SPHN|nr:efflux RND transporter permease subunit [Croceibacterium atlanticum]AKH43852.1 Multidrug export protein AcrF [Croceibacterium atlanticum]MBB5733698.1 multidrug efflux pump [Croceibacterium atlanticum]
MVLSDLSVRRPVVAAVTAILLTIIGIVGFLSLSVRELPETDPPVVSVSTEYTGASAAVIESRITQPLEDRLAGIAGIETITSLSRDGRSDISIEFSPGRDVDAAANDVRDRVSGASDNLPEDALAPEVRKVDADARPILFFIVRGQGWDPLELGDYAERVLVDRISNVDGVAQVNVFGDSRPAMRVWLDMDRLAAYQLTPRDIETALRTQNVELPAGRIESTQRNLSLRVDRSFVTPEDFGSLVVGRGADGYLVRLGDVSRIERGPENPYTRFRLNGETGVGLGVVRQSGANTLKVAEDAKAAMAAMEPDLPEGITVDTGSDSSLFIDRAIESVYHTLGEAAVLVVLVIFLFLGSWRATLIPAITVPICLLATFAVLWLFGFSINLLTLLALVLAIGLVVDDAIVVLENIHHRIENGEKPLVAAYLGARQVGFAVIATTLVVCAVFVPVMFISGQTGLLFRELAAAMISAIALSGFLALTLTPMLCSKILKHDQAGSFSARIDKIFARVEASYAGWLDRCFKHPLLVYAPVAAMLALAGWLFTTLPAELAPAEDTGVIETRLSAPEGTSFAALDGFVREAEAKVLPMMDEGAIRGVIGRLPSGRGNSDFNEGRLVIFLTPWEEREQTSADVAADLNNTLTGLAAVRGNATVRSSLGRGRGQPINFVIAGATYDSLAIARDRILAAARNNPGIINLDADYVESKPQILIDVDRERAGDLGVSVEDVSQALQTLMGSRRVSTYVQNGEEYRVIVQAAASERDREQKLSSIYVRSRTGELVPLSNLVSLREETSARELGRFNKMRAITLQGGLADGYPMGEALAFLEDQARASPEVLAIGYRGESESFKQTGSSIWIVFGFTIVTIYLLLAAQFESFIHPAVIITAVPPAFAGGVFGLALTGDSINLYSQIGLVMLVGLAAKNGILIVEFANQLRDEGREFADAIRSAARRRLRPILMTSIATVMGGVPLALATGAGAGARAAIGMVLVAGVSLATLVTIFLVPVLYAALTRRTSSPQAVTRELQSALSDKGLQPEASS